MQPKGQIMNSDNSPKQLSNPHKTQSMILPEENHSMLKNPSPEQWQDKKRTLVCLLKWDRLETSDQFAERIVAAWLEDQTKQPMKQAPQKPE